MKHCYLCKTWKPKSAYTKNRSKKDGLCNECPQCRAHYRGVTNVDRIKEVTRIYREKNADKIKARNHRYKLANKEKIAAYNKKYNSENRDKLNTNNRDKRKENPEKFQAKERAYRARPEVKERLKKYREARKLKKATEIEITPWYTPSPHWTYEEENPW